MKERTKFILEWEKRWDRQEGQVNVSELCRMFGISRESGHLWIRRYQKAGRDLRALEERSRRPHSCPTAISDEMQDFVVAARKAHPRWGPRKLRAWMVERYPGRQFASASAMSAVLQRRGMITPRRRRRRAEVPVTQPFAACDRPNAVWCVDFKGWFLTLDGVRCYPLTLMDAFSRYLLRCEAMVDPVGWEVQRVFDSAFREFGLPGAIRSDNGPPFASTGAAGLTWLSVWWLRLGIRVERIQPGKPQQNGRHERMHLTLKIEVEPQAEMRAQQRALDYFRREYNQERPHEALGQKPPASVYQPSLQRYPRPLLRATGSGHECPTDKHGFIRWNRRRVLISAALARETVLLWPTDGPRWEVYFGPILLGHIDEARLDRGLILPPRRRSQPRPAPGALRTVLSLAQEAP